MTRPIGETVDIQIKKENVEPLLQALATRGYRDIYRVMIEYVQNAVDSAIRL